MVKIKTAIIAIFIIFQFNIFSQSIPENIIIAFQKGNSTMLLPFLNKNIELTIENNNNFYSKEQAELILKDFFNKNNITSFKITHQGEKNNALFFIGLLITNKGIYRVTAYLKTNNNQKFIHHLRIEKGDE